VIVHSTWRGATLAPRPTTQNGATAMNHHTCDQGPGHPILATNRGTCPACPDPVNTPDQDEARTTAITGTAIRLTNDLYALATTDDGASPEVVDHVQEFLEYAMHLAASRLADPDDEDVALEMDRHLREMEGGR
jgi:hypothetical protein